MIPTKTQSTHQRDVEPIRDLEDIKRIRAHLKNKPRDLLLFDIAAQTGLGMKKILGLKVKQLLGLKAGEEILGIARSNEKYSLTITEEIYTTFIEYIRKSQLGPEDYLFKSTKGSRPLNLSSVSNIIKGWFEAANIPNVYGAISLRKTYQYHSLRPTSADTAAPQNLSTTLFKPLNTPTAQEIIFNKLLEAIISGKIPPGSRLTTAEISKAFDVSQAPVRVALNWLEAKGFITTQKKRASIVKKLSIDELKEIMFIRSILETAAVKLAINNCTPETLHKAESIIDESTRAHDLEELDRLNTKFHQVLYRDAGMPLLLQLIADLCARVSPYAILHHSTSNTDLKKYADDVEFHQSIVDGMRNKDIKKVLKYIKMDLNKATGKMEEIFKDRC
jgi:DNA-binding GntR family transcriptional regulator